MREFNKYNNFHTCLNFEKKATFSYNHEKVTIFLKPLKAEATVTIYIF